jgi:hypothetical protein
MSTGSYNPVEAMETAIAIVSCTVQQKHETATALASGLNAEEARFAVIVVAEYLSQAVRIIAGHEMTTVDDVWQQFCMTAAHAIERARFQSFGRP